MTSAENSELQLSSFNQHTAIAHASTPITVLCDFDGPLVDVSERYYKTYQLGLAATQTAYQTQGAALPLQALTKQQFWQMKQHRVADAEIALRSGLQGEQIQVFLERVRQLVNQSVLLQQDHLQPGVRRALALLHACGVNLVVVTLRCQAQASQILESYGLAHFFMMIRGTQEGFAAYQNSTELKKQLVSEVVNEQALPQSEIWLVGDTEADVIAGQAAGISTIAVTCGIRSAAYLNRHQPTRIHSDLGSAADYLSGLTQLVRA